MIQTVLDANVFVSGLLGLRRDQSPPGEILRRWHDDAFLVVTSAPLTAEILRTLTEPVFLNAIAMEDRAAAEAGLLENSLNCELVGPIERIASHPEDDLILAATVAGNADVLVTGVKQLLALGVHRGVRIVTARGFLAILDAAYSLLDAED